MEKEKGLINLDQENLESFIEGELEEIELRKKEYMEEKGFAEFIKFESGETKIVLQPVIPRKAEGSFGDRRIFRVTVNEIEYDWSVNPRSPMYRQMLELLKKAPIKITVIRTGEKKNTRYDIKV